MPIWHWVVAIIIYCLIDNILSYGSFNLRGFNRQFGTMFIFLGVIGVGRPYFDRWLMKRELKSALRRFLIAGFMQTYVGLYAGFCLR